MAKPVNRVEHFKLQAGQKSTTRIVSKHDTGTMANLLFCHMKRFKRFGAGVAVLAGLYLFLPILIFDFTSVAVPYDEENFKGRPVAIGPKPWWWVPKAARHLDMPGGLDYEPDGWTFVVWKPLCVTFVRAKGYELPAAWR